MWPFCSPRPFLANLPRLYVAAGICTVVAIMV